MKGRGHLLQGVAELDFHLSRVANPPPFADKRLAAEEMWLHVQDVIAVLIVLGLVLVKAGIGRGHGVAPLAVLA
jgi:hypothetical protein